LAFTASAQCASCMKEGDWTQSAASFLEGKPISEEPVEFGPKAVRKTESQFENEPDANQETGENDASAAASSAGEAAQVEIILQSINATPALPVSASPVKITAVFALNDSDQSENQTEIQLTATASIKNSTGNEVENINLIKTSGNEYSNDWVASVPAGFYSVDIAISSLQGSASFNDVLQIEVVGSANATKTAPAAENLG
jgi:hypothetical protein